MSLTCDICRADWKWLEARVCLRRCSCVYRARQAESGLCQQPTSQPLSAAVDSERVSVCMTDSVHECVFSGRSGQKGWGWEGGHLAGCSIRGPWMCGQGHRQSGSLKVGLKTLS